MGRYDLLTTLDSEPVKPATPTEKPASQNRPILSPLSERHEASKPANRQTRLQVNLQTGKDASRQAGKLASMQTGKQVNLQTGKQVFIEKYSSYLTHEYKGELKRIAFESDRKEYEVLLEAVEQYLTRHKQSK